MKVLIINSHIRKGGAARIADYTHEELIKRGFEVKTVYGRGEEPPSDDYIKIESEASSYKSALLTRLTGKVGHYNTSGTKRVLKLIEEWKPDIIHLHNVHGYYINIPLLFEGLAKANIPVVWTLHDCFSFTGKCGYHFECDKWKSGCGDCQYLKGYPKVYRDMTASLWAEKKELATSIPQMTIVSPSDWLTAEAKESYLGKYDCVTIRNGIDTDNTFYPREKKEIRAKYGFDQQDKIVLGIAVGYSDPRKGAKYIIDLAKELENSAKIVLVGWESENDHLINNLSNVITVPAIKDANILAEYYSMADVFVIPSLAENYATTTLEALACGSPCVGFDAGGTPEQIWGDRGLCVAAGDQKAFNNAVLEVLSSGKYHEREAIGADEK